jgi:hypothetical protein
MVFDTKNETNRGFSVIHKTKLLNSCSLNFSKRNTLEDKQWTSMLGREYPDVFKVH